MLHRISRSGPFALFLIFAFLNYTASPAMAAPAIVLHNWSGTIKYSGAGLTPFTLAGTASHLGNFTAIGQAHFEPDGNGGAVATGVVVFTAADGDRLAGLVTWQVDPHEDHQHASISFAWRDSVTFSDGHIETSTGRFEDARKRPPGLVVIAVIAILIGTLLPCVQKPGCGTTPR